METLLFLLFIATPVLLGLAFFWYLTWSSIYALFRELFSRKRRFSSDDAVSRSRLEASLRRDSQLAQEYRVLIRWLERMRGEGLIDPEEGASLRENSHRWIIEHSSFLPSDSEAAPRPAREEKSRHGLSGIGSGESTEKGSPRAAFHEDEEPVMAEVVEAQPMEPVRPSMEPFPEKQPAASKEPREPFREKIRRFMESHDMYWAEVVSVFLGIVLIVGPSIALMINFWQFLTSYPFFRPVLFTLIALGTFGIGFFLKYRWQLKKTGTVFLTIGTLLAPVLLVAMLRLVNLDFQGDRFVLEQDFRHQFWTFGGSFIFSVTAFILVYLSGKTFLDANRTTHAALALATVAAPFSLFGITAILSKISVESGGGEPLLRGFLGPIDGDTSQFVIILLGPSLCFLISSLVMAAGESGIQARRFGTRVPDDEEKPTWKDRLDVALRQSRRSLVFLGFGGFSTIIALVGLSFILSGEVRPTAASFWWLESIRVLALSIALVAIPVLLTGQVVFREMGRCRTREVEAYEDRRALDVMQTLGAFIALLAIALQLLALGAVWPHPVPMLLVTGVALFPILMITFRDDFAPADIAAMILTVWVVMTTLYAFHCGWAIETGRIGSVWEGYTRPLQATGLFAVAVLLGAISEGLFRQRRRDDLPVDLSRPKRFAVGAALVGALSLAMTIRLEASAGSFETWQAAWIWSIAGILTLLGVLRWSHRSLAFFGFALSAIGSVLLLIAIWPECFANYIILQDFTHPRLIFSEHVFWSLSLAVEATLLVGLSIGLRKLLSTSPEAPEDARRNRIDAYARGAFPVGLVLVGLSFLGWFGTMSHYPNSWFSFLPPLLLIGSLSAVAFTRGRPWFTYPSLGVGFLLIYDLLVDPQISLDRYWAPLFPMNEPPATALLVFATLCLIAGGTILQGIRLPVRKKRSGREDGEKRHGTLVENFGEPMMHAAISATLVFFFVYAFGAARHWVMTGYLAEYEQLFALETAWLAGLLIGLSFYFAARPSMAWLTEKSRLAAQILLTLAYVIEVVTVRRYFVHTPEADAMAFRLIAMMLAALCPVTLLVRWTLDRHSYLSRLLFRQGILFGLVALPFALVWCNALGYGVLSGIQLAVVLFLLGFGTLLLAVQEESPVAAVLGAGLFVVASGQWILRVPGEEGLPMAVRVLLTVSPALACYAVISWLFERLPSLSVPKMALFSSSESRFSLSAVMALGTCVALGSALGLGTGSYLLFPAVFWQPDAFCGWGALAAVVAVALKIVDRDRRLLPSMVYILIVSCLLGILPFVPTDHFWQRWWYLGLLGTAMAYLPVGLLVSLASWGRLRTIWREQPGSLQWWLQAHVVHILLLMGWSLAFLFASFGENPIPWFDGENVPAVRAAAPLCLFLLLPATALLQGRNVLRLLYKEQTVDELHLREAPKRLRETGWTLLTIVLAETFWLMLPTMTFTVEHMAWLILAIVLVRLSAVTLVEKILATTGAAPPRWYRPWHHTGLSLKSSFDLAIVFATAGTLLLESNQVFQRGEEVGDFSVVWLSLVLLGIVSGLIRHAILLAEKKSGQALRKAEGFVYLAEGVGLLCFYHLWLCRPWLFELGILEEYWAYVVLGIAYTGVALAELFRRQNVAVLVRPLEITVMFLPLVSLAGQWSSPAAWFLIAFFYGIIAHQRRSLKLLFFAIFLGNIGLWLLWHQWDLELVDYPQLWFMPLALILLITEAILRRHLEPGVAKTLRWLGLAGVYLPSALKFYQTLGTSIAMPLVLIGISIAGIVVGFMMRVRSFILVGIVSILMVIGTMIQYAYVDLDQTWVLWVACIVLGFLILTFFAWFERNRDRLLTHLRQFKEWDNRRREETQEKSETESARE